MVDELISIEQLERIRRLVVNGNIELAVAHIDVIVDERKKRVAEFEEEMFGNLPV